MEGKTKLDNDERKWKERRKKKGSKKAKKCDPRKMKKKIRKEEEKKDRKQPQVLVRRTENVHRPNFDTRSEKI